MNSMSREVHKLCGVRSNEETAKSSKNFKKSKYTCNNPVSGREEPDMELDLRDVEKLVVVAGNPDLFEQHLKML